MYYLPFHREALEDSQRFVAIRWRTNKKWYKKFKWFTSILQNLGIDPQHWNLHRENSRRFLEMLVQEKMYIWMFPTYLCNQISKNSMNFTNVFQSNSMNVKWDDEQKMEFCFFEIEINLVCLIGIMYKLNVKYAKQKMPIAFYIMQ